MKVEIVREEGDEMELSIDDLTVASMITKYLQDDDRVRFAAFRQEHPLESEVKLFFRVKSGNPREVLMDAVKKALSDVKELKDVLLSSLP